MFLNIIDINKSTTTYARYEKIVKCMSSVYSRIFVCVKLSLHAPVILY